jgi:hypothetical protein
MATIFQCVSGTLFTAQCTFTVAGALTDPSTVTVLAQCTNGTPVVGAVTKVSLGVWTANIDTTGCSGWLGGTYIGTGACQVAENFAVEVVNQAG